MNKAMLFKQVVDKLIEAHQGAVAAAARAHATATNNESIAENKYDTFGLEASYLAQGQSARVEQCRVELEQFIAMVKRCENAASTAEPRPVFAVELGSLVMVNDNKNQTRAFLLGPAAAGLTLKCEAVEVTCITPQSPIGKVLLGKEVDQEFDLKIGTNNQTFDVIALY